MDNNINPNDIYPDNPVPSIPTIWDQKYFKVLIMSNIISVLSLFIFMASGQLLLSGQDGYIAFPLILVSGFLTMIFGNVFAISTIYTFIKTIKKKDPVSRAHNIYSKYILVACLVSGIYLFMVYRVFNLYLYLETNSLEMINFIPFILINIAGLTHLIILNNKYRNHQQSPPSSML